MARTKGSTFIHPLAEVDRGASIGAGTRIWQYTIIKKGSTIGENCNIGSHCYVEWDAQIGDNVTIKNGVSVWEGVRLEDGVFIGPNAIFTNDIYPRSPRLPEARARYRDPSEVIMKTHVRYGASIGAGAMILAGITIGRFAFVGLGAVALQSIPDHALVTGTPARKVGWMCECGLPISEKRLTCAGCGRTYRLKSNGLRRIS